MCLRVWRKTAVRGSASARQQHSDLFKLFGRAPVPQRAEGGGIGGDAKPHDVRAHKQHRAHAEEDALREMGRYEAEAYVTANHVSDATKERTLSAIRKALSPPSSRFTASNSAMWREALRIVHDGPQADGSSQGRDGGGAVATRSRRTPPVATPAASSSLECIAECCCALMLSRHSAPVRDLAAQAGIRSGAPVSCAHRLTSPRTFCATARIASCYVLSCCGSLHEGSSHTEFDKRAIEPVLSLLAGSREITAKLESREERREVVVCVELLFASLDWLFHDSLGDFINASEQGTTGMIRSEAVLPSSSDSLFAPAKELAPKWLRQILFTPREQLRASAHRPLSDAPDIPSHIRLQLQDAAERQDTPELRRLFQLSRRKEEMNVDWRLFELTTCAGELVLRQARGTHAREAAAMLGYLGTALDPETLAKSSHVLGRDGESAAVHWLVQARGALAYAALKKSLLHRGPDELAAIQQRCGDILTGDKKATWQSALEATHALMELGQSLQWRRQLPTTLRLLSDAGRFKEFFFLVREYDTSLDGGAGNLPVAAALGQAMRRTGKWHFYKDVLDLVSAAPVPSADAEDYFLEDAALQTLYSLRNAKRWREAATFFGLMRPAMPPSALRVFASALSEAAAALLVDGESAPREEVETLLQLARVRREELPAELAEAVAVYAGGPDAINSTNLADLEVPLRRHVQRVCAQSGLWRPLLSFVRHIKVARDAAGSASKDDEVERVACLDFLRGLERCREDINPLLQWKQVDELIPADVWSDERGAVQLFHTALWNGWLREFRGTLRAKMHSMAVPTGSRAPLRVFSQLEALASFLIEGKVTPPTRETGTVDPRGDSFSVVSRSAEQDPQTGVRHSLVGHYYTSFVTRGSFRIAISSAVSRTRHKDAIARYFRVPPVCVGGGSAPRVTKGGAAETEATPSNCFLRPYPVLPDIAAEHVFWSTRDVIIAYKPAGAVQQSVARGVLQLLDASSTAAAYHEAFLIPPASEGLFVLISTATNPKRFVFDVVVSVPLIPLSDSRVALLSTTFFQRFAMRLHDRGTGGMASASTQAGVVSARAMLRNVDALNGSASLRSIKAAANEEGWTLAEREVGAGEAFSVEEIHLSDRTTGMRLVVR